MRRKTWALAAAAVLVVAIATGGVVVMSSADQSTPVAQDTPASTVNVEKGRLSSMVSLHGTLTRRARSDGSPYAAINQASGTYTELPETGDRVGCGDVLQRVDDEPVLLLCGIVPAYRDVAIGDEGKDVRQLNRNLHRLGYDADAGVEIDPGDDCFTWRTQLALMRLQQDTGFDDVTGALEVDDAVFLPGPVRIGKVAGQLGGAARPGADVAYATSDTLVVQVDLDASQQGEVREGDRARIMLPGNRSAKGRVDRLGSVAQTTEEDDVPASATIPAFISLDKPGQARGLDEAPVQVEVATRGVQSALSVPVTALVGRSGGGFAVEVVRDGGRRELVAVRLGLFDTTAGRVEVEGDLDERDRVVVPAL